jgi:cardiolipin synthase
VQPYADSPHDRERIISNVYLHIIHAAKEYVYINSPYLIIDDTMISALTLAAKSGIDMRIVTPSRADKWYVHTVTRSYYRELIRAGVKIYEYTDGFIHSKTIVSDGYTAAVGTANLDYRSLYLHFECGVRMCGSSAVRDLYMDFIKTLERCEPITLEKCINNPLSRVVQDTLRLFGPLM